MNTMLYHATRDPQLTIENQLRALRIWEYLEETTPPVTYKELRRDMGLSYRQTVIAIGLLVSCGVVHVMVTPEWNGCNYIYPHRILLEQPPCL